MLHKVKTLKQYRLDSLDGEMGSVADFYFDDQHWTIRYLVANTGNWLTGRQVLISPHALVAAIREEKHIAVDLTKNQIEESPPLASDRPVSRQHEAEFHRYYGWPAYWGGTYAWGTIPYPGAASINPLEPQPSGDVDQGDPHLRGTEGMDGYHIQTSDGELGHVEDFIIDDVTWAIRYLVIDTRNFWPGKKVLMIPQWIERVSWSESKVYLGLPKATIRDAPAYDEHEPLSRAYEEELYQYYGRKGYWITEEASMARVH